jgi:hypothetical protein
MNVLIRLHLNASEIQASRRGRDGLSVKVGALAKMSEFTELRCEKNRATSLPFNDFIKFILDSSLFVRRMCSRHQDCTYRHSSLPPCINVHNRKEKKDALPFRFQLQKKHQPDTPSRSLISHTDAHSLEHILQTRGQCPRCSAVEKLKYHVKIGNATRTICSFTRFSWPV